MKRLAGYAILGLLFGALFGLSAAVMGWTEAAAVFGGVALIITLVSIAAHWIVEG